MSYTFTCKAATPDDLAAEIRTGYAEMLKQNPEHAAEQEPVMATVNKLCSLLEPGCPKGYAATVSGSLGWNGTGDGSKPKVFNHCSVSINIGKQW